MPRERTQDRSRQEGLKEGLAPLLLRSAHSRLQCQLDAHAVEASRTRCGAAQHGCAELAFRAQRPAGHGGPRCGSARAVTESDDFSISNMSESPLTWDRDARRSAREPNSSRSCFRLGEPSSPAADSPPQSVPASPSPPALAAAAPAGEPGPGPGSATPFCLAASARAQ